MSSSRAFITYALARRIKHTLLPGVSPSGEESGRAEGMEKEQQVLGILIVCVKNSIYSICDLH